MRQALRWLCGGLIGLVLLVSIGLAGGFFWLRQSLPVVDGTHRGAGAGRAGRRSCATPMPCRTSRPQASRMRSSRRASCMPRTGCGRWISGAGSAAGRLAEVLGPAALPTDRFIRTLGFERAARASLAHLRPDTVALLEAYAAGVNAYLATRSGPLPLEFLILGYEPEPWTAGRFPGLDAGAGARSQRQLARRTAARAPRQAPVLGPDRRSVAGKHGGPDHPGRARARRCRPMRSPRCCRRRRRRAWARTPGCWMAAAPQAARRCSPTTRIWA